MIAQDFIDSYNKNGFVIVPGLIPPTAVSRIRKVIYQLYKKARPDNKALHDIAQPWLSREFDRAMIALRAEDKSAFGALYDSAQGTTELAALVLSDACREMAAGILGDDPASLSFSGLMLRMDTPQDRRNTLNWHQDHSYYPQNSDGRNGMVMTIALQGITKDIGALEVCPGSHMEGFCEPENIPKVDYETSEQRRIPADKVEKYDSTFAEMNAGDALFLHMDLFHKSGDNVTDDKIRYSILTRFHRTLADDFVAFDTLYQFNEYMLSRQSSALKNESID